LKETNMPNNQINEAALDRAVRRFARPVLVSLATEQNHPIVVRIFERLITAEYHRQRASGA
jgi:hypothetical protein